MFVFGGSTTFGIGLPDEQTIPSYLGECAANHSRGHLAVYNFGRPGYISSQELILFQQLLNSGFVPRVAVFIDGLNDFSEIFPDGQPMYAERFRRFMAGKPEFNLFDDVPVVKAADWLSVHWTKLPPQKPVEYADRIDRWLANKRMIELIAQGFGVRTIFVWQPVPTYEYDLRYHFLFRSDKEFDTFGRSGYGYPLMENLRAQGKLGPNVLWLADMQQEKRENLYVDQIHYNAVFSKEIAAQMCGFLGK